MLEQVAAAAFGQRRKMLRQSLKSLSVDPMRLATAAGIELWVGETATGKAHKIEGVRVNEVMAPPVTAAAGGRGQQQK